MWTIPPFEELQRTLQDPFSLIGKRMRAAYFCKQLFFDEKSDSDLQNDVVELLCSQVTVEEHGSLMRHEFAYVLGQLQTPKACSALEILLQSSNDCVMVRHEAAEALGAIASPSSRRVLQDTYKQYTGELDELADTCKLALNRIDNQDKITDAPVVGCACMMAPYNSVDPASPDPRHQHLSTDNLGDLLLDSNLDLVERYRAMFSLRDRGGTQSVQQLCGALLQDTSSPLLRHELAFVLGQLQHPSSISALTESLSRTEEHVMVRHESAEALGAIEGTADEWQQIEQTLLKYQKDSVLAVAESCIVALDAADYWGNSTVTTETKNHEDYETKDQTQEPLSFGQQKNQSTSIRKYILEQHFNVKTTAS
jgi:deoxyhypusine monooxygenase